MSQVKKHDAGASEGARRATEDAPASSATAGGGRWSSKRKVLVILELLRGADLESTSRKHRVTAATLTEWRDRFLAGGEAMLRRHRAPLAAARLRQTGMGDGYRPAEARRALTSTESRVSRV